MSKIQIKCPKCGAFNTMIDYHVIKNVMNEKCSKCGHVQQMSLIRCLKSPETIYW